MSSRNGDKARYGRLRKKKLARRDRMKTLKVEIKDAGAKTAGGTAPLLES